MDRPRPTLAALAAAPDLAALEVRPGRTPDTPALETGVTALDALLGGGFPRGRISEVVGPPGSGRTSVLLGAFAQATRRGALAALVDVTDGLDPASARARGVVLGSLLWIRCGGSLRAALRAADVILRGGGFDAVGVDLGDLPPETVGRVPAAAIVRLQRAVEATSAALVLAGSCRAAGSLAATAIALRPRPARWARGGPGLLAGLETEVRLLRARARPGLAAIRVAWVIAP